MSGDAVGLSLSSTTELLGAYAAILNELESRGVVRTRNAPAGDYAEWLCQKALGGSLEPNSAKSHDLTLADGTRIQVKCRVVTDPTKQRQQLSAIRSWDFDLLAVVLLDPVDYSVLLGVLLPVDVVRPTARWIERVKADRVDLTPELLSQESVSDITGALRSAAAAPDTSVAE